MKCEVKLFSSLEKIFFHMPMDVQEYKKGSMLKNEIFSFQMAAYGGECVEQRMWCKLRVTSELEPYITVKSVGYVPTLVPSIEMNDDDDYISKEPGLYPDTLHSIKNGEITLAFHQVRAFWITVEPKGDKIGNYPILLEITDYSDNVLAEASFTLEIIDAELPQTEVRNTCWFHGDCIAKLHKVEVMSEAYWELVNKYLSVYTKFGHNMILTPIFTPALDTVVGKERPTNQLVDVVVNRGEYTFRFDNLKRWIKTCQNHGIRFFEMSHLFTQWGAKHAPKIMATVDGKYRRIFGWETDALGVEYREFLSSFLPKLVVFLKEEGVMESCYFHVSDEPSSMCEQQYAEAKKHVCKYVPEEQWIDALSNYSFYEKGIVSKPIVSNNHIHTFLEHGVHDLWTYYCMSQRKNVANRFIAMPSYRHRILGYQLYKYDIQGFLHWGFNFWFLQGSLGTLNPYIDTCAGGGYQSGDAFIVYPLDEDDEVVCSLRLYVLNESFQDMRALELLEKLADRETVMELLVEIDGFDTYPRNAEYILQLREMVNQKIKSYSNKVMK